VQRTDEDPTLFDVIYHGEHICASTAYTTTESQSWSATSDSDDEDAEVPGQNELQEASPALVAMDILDDFTEMDLASFFA
jgi:hypothetical protein